jgi:hypothetical protein
MYKIFSSYTKVTSIKNKLLMLLNGHFYIYNCFENKRFFNSSPLIPLLLPREGETGVEF